AVGDVAVPGDVAARRRRIAGRVLAGVVRPVALVAAAGVAVVGARRPRGALRVPRTGGAGPGAVLHRITLARRGPADDGGGLEGVGRARRARAGALLGHVAVTGHRAAGRAAVARRVPAGFVRRVAP